MSWQLPTLHKVITPPSIVTHSHPLPLAFNEMGNGNCREASYGPRPTSLYACSHTLVYQVGRGRGLILSPRPWGEELHMEECYVPLWSTQRDSHRQWLPVYLIWLPRLLQRVGDQTLLFHFTLSQGQWLGRINQQEGHQEHQKMTQESKGIMGW